MFDQTFVNAEAHARRPWTVALSLTLQSVLIAALLVIPILRVAPIELPTKVPPIWLPVHVVDMKVRPTVQTAARTAPSIRPSLDVSRLIAPTKVAPLVGPLPDAPDVGIAGYATSSIGPIIPGIGIGPIAPPVTVKPEPARQIAQPSPTPAAPVRVSVGVQAAKLIFGPRPAYPALARNTRTEGTVKIQALIGADGVIRNLQLIGGPPLLVKAAMDAVGQWRYQPTLLNGVAVEVITEIDVNFTLNR